MVKHDELSPHRQSDDMTSRVEFVGVERSPVLIIDNFSANPEGLVEAAARTHFIDVGPTYPGVRGPAPDGYGQWALDAFAPEIQRLFDGVANWGFDMCAFSMVTTPPHALTPVQTVPHFDGPEPNRLAFLHYLCDASHGGTSFYRQRSTGFERIHPDRVLSYLDHLERRAASAPAYAFGDSDQFERIGGVEAAFNRAVFYPGSLLHSGDILAPALLTEDVRRGRLTINGFVVLDPA